MSNTLTRAGSLTTSGPEAWTSPQDLRIAIKRRTSPTKPGVSVLMNAYNAMPYLPAAVESVLRQTYTNLQLVIIDDGSTDGGPGYLKTLRDDRVCIVRQANRGTAAAANVGILHCDRRYIARMDADDLCPPERLALQVEHLDTRPEVVAVGSAFQYFGDRQIGPIIKLPLEHEPIASLLRRGHHAMVHGSIMMRSDALHQIGGYWEHPFFEDWDLFLRLAERGRLENLNQSLYQYRALATSISGHRMAEMRLHYDYAIDAAARRVCGQRPIELAEFTEDRQELSWWRRCISDCDNRAMSSYRRALGECYGDAVMKGRLRLLAAASLSPGRTLRRVLRGGTV